MGEIERESGSGNWLTTYSDMVTLLLVFFVLLYVLTPGIDQSKFNDILSYFQSSSSVVFEKESASKKQDDGRLRKEWKEVKKFLKEQELSSEVDVEKTEEGVRITLRDSLTFNSGSARLLPKAEIVLKRIADAIGKDVKEVKTRGHTDDVPISESSIYRSNWHLGAARAVSVVRFLNSASILESRRFEASSYGEFRPIATNETKEGRRKNRRVEIYINYYEDRPVEKDSANVRAEVLTTGIKTQTK